MSHDGRVDSPIGDEAESGGLGCPMLVRGHASVARGTRPLVRCSLGWAIRGEHELARCVATESCTKCWKAQEDHGALHEAAFTASRSAKRRAAAGQNGQETITEPGNGHEVVVPAGLPVRRPGPQPRPVRPEKRSRESGPLNVPLHVERDEVAADH
jgi:hypothetical protein